ncbi:mannose-6-phosphate receptor binding domain-containing protein [Paraphoma chrysanthemicola]|uniref:Mannose-6-phosphate receptor binding domain-containing protein n=1 Tax=Paraphoma chrysanthemicola TaxID=798071 RepID=A0A8K0W049_9PLEO|nr:mannose-6-phosphate receptor binding domain-containing protein [Paraphoma chrysanthemicola]
MKSLLYSLLLLASSRYAAAASDKVLKPCTIVSPTTERFFDLNPIRRLPAEEGKKKGDTEGSWHARGYDYGANFTLNFCGPVVEELHDVQDLEKTLWKNVSAFYEVGKKVYAIGLENTEPVFRGRKLIVNYTGGSLCPSSSSKSRRQLEPVSLPSAPREIIDDDDDDDDKPKKKPSSDKGKEDKNARRKTTVISLLCDSDPLAKTSVSFVAAVDECTYFFEGRSPFACGGVHQATQALGPGGVFSVIILIAVLVYFAGGCVYQRTVMHQRGWRQLPNYAMWAGIYRFIADMFIILTSSCARFMPSRRGYSRVSLGQDNGRRGRRNEDENRLIDNLDEEWDD